MNDSQNIAQILLKLKAVNISPSSPFTWASGLRSPLYCDNRLLISTVVERRRVIAAFVKLFQRQGWRPDVIAGTATAGIPHAAWLAEELSLPMIYIRAAEKGHGKRNQIEGRLAAQANTVVIEDLISTGGSSIKAATLLREAGARVLGVAAIFQYGMNLARQRFSQAGFGCHTLTDLDTLMQVAVQEGLLDQQERAVVETWREDPQAWSRAWEERGS